MRRFAILALALAVANCARLPVDGVQPVGEQVGDAQGHVSIGSEQLDSQGQATQAGGVHGQGVHGQGGIHGQGVHGQGAHGQGGIHGQGAHGQSGSHGQGGIHGHHPGQVGSQYPGSGHVGGVHGQHPVGSAQVGGAHGQHPIGGIQGQYPEGQYHGQVGIQQQPGQGHVPVPPGHVHHPVHVTQHSATVRPTYSGSVQHAQGQTTVHPDHVHQGQIPVHHGQFPIHQGQVPVHHGHPVHQGQQGDVQHGQVVPVGIIQQDAEVNPDGSFHNVWESENGIKVQEEGTVKLLDQNTLAHTVTGHVSYTDIDGNPIVLSYVADENGFHPVGDHLPTPPPIPQGIARGLEWIRAHPPADEEHVEKTESVGVH